MDNEFYKCRFEDAYGSMEEYTRLHVGELLHRMYDHDLSDDYIDHPDDGKPHSYCSREFLDETVLLEFKESMKSVGYNMSWVVRYRYWKYEGKYDRQTCRYVFYLSQIDPEKPVLQLSLM